MSLKNLRREVAERCFMQGLLPIRGILDIISQYGDEFEGVLTDSIHNEHVVSAMVAMPNNKIAVGVGARINVWDLSTGIALELARHECTVFTLAVVSADRLASGSYDCKVKVWNTTTAECLVTMDDYCDWVSILHILKDGMLVSGGHQNPIRVSDPTTGTRVAILNEKASVVLEVQGKIVVSLSAGRIVMWDYKENTTTYAHVHTAPVTDLVGLPNDKFASCGGECSGDNTIAIWNAACQHLFSIFTHSLYAKGLSLLANGTLAVRTDQGLCVWNLDDGECLYEFKDLKDAHTLVEVPGKYIALSLFDQRIIICDAMTGAVIKILGDPVDTTDTTGMTIALGYTRNGVKVYGKVVRQLIVFPDGRLVAAGPVSQTIEVYE